MLRRNRGCRFRLLDRSVNIALLEQCAAVAEEGTDMMWIRRERCIEMADGGFGLSSRQLCITR